VPAEGDRPTTVVLVVDDQTEVVLARLDPRRPDLRVVDALAGLALCARRRGWRVRVRDCSPRLGELIALAGLAEVLGLEPRREAEGLEPLGVEEVVQRGDPPA
jgi:hypothetical protein